MSNNLSAYLVFPYEWRRPSRLNLGASEPLLRSVPKLIAGVLVIGGDEALLLVDGSYWLADYRQYKVWKVTATGQVEAVAGDGGWRASGDGGAAFNATLHQPRDVLYDNAGNLYIADAGNHRVL